MISSNSCGLLIVFLVFQFDMMMELEPVSTCRKILISACIFYLPPLALTLIPFKNSEGNSK